MKISPIAAPAAPEASQPTAQDAKSRAIAKFMGNQPVQDANKVSLEELSVVRAPSEQNHIEEETVAPVEAPKAEETKTEDPLSAQHALIARKERALRAKVQQQEQTFKAREEALKAREAALAAKDQEYATGYISKQKLKEQTLATLAEADISYDSLTQQLIDSQNPQDPRITAHIAKLEAKLSKLEEMNEQGRKSQVEQQDQAYKAAVKQIETDVKSLVSSDPNFEMVKATGSIKDVVELIELTYKEDGILLSVEDAAQQVEDHLLAEVEKLTRLDKIKKRLSPPPAAKSEADTQTPIVSKQPQTMKTLTNASASSRQLSARERAMLAFKGELK